MRYSRRLTLVSIAWAVGMPAALAAHNRPDTGDATESSAARLRALIADRRRARLFGREYRSQCPAESQPAILTKLLCSGLGLDDAAPALWSRDRLLAALNSRVRAEFGRGDAVLIQGWVMARSEARLCALFY
jgi:hypothetical protein